MALGVAEHCVVATDSDEVARECAAHGADVVLTHPSHPSGTDRVAEVASLERYARFEAIVNVQGDEPFVSSAAVAGAVACVTTGRFALATAAVPAAHESLANPHVVKVVADDAGRVMYFSRAPIPFLREARDETLLARRVWHHLGVYAYTRDALARWVALPPHPLERIERLEQLRPLAAGMAMGIALIDEEPRAGIDTEDDLARANSDWTAFTTLSPNSGASPGRRA
jgi:3-deoxy-manno-octulosonate cytidylyltransferase (CMP-KDO synthetase)